MLNVLIYCGIFSEDGLPPLGVGLPGNLHTKSVKFLTLPLIVLNAVKNPRPLCKLYVHTLSQFPPQIATDVEFNVQVSSGLRVVIDEMQFVAVFGGIACQLNTIAEVAKLIGGLVLIFPQRDVADVI